MGNDGANVIRGGGGDDVLTGLGGDDTYYVDDLAARIVEAANGGRDTVYASISYALGAGLETLSAASLAATDPLQLSGNALDNDVYGNAGANVLKGGGGVDRLFGGGGDDIYYVTDGREVVFEQANGGRDIVYAGLSHGLTAGSHVEVLSALSLGSTDPLQLSGNALNNEIYGNAGANVLRGGGGVDLLLGGFGDDIYYVTSGGETVLEYAGEGRDIVYTSVSHVLTPGSHVEILSAVSLSGTGALQLYRQRARQRDLRQCRRQRPERRRRHRHHCSAAAATTPISSIDGRRDHRSKQAGRRQRHRLCRRSATRSAAGSHVEIAFGRHLAGRHRRRSTSPATSSPTSSTAMPAPTSSTAAAAPTRWSASAATTPITSTSPATTIVSRRRAAATTSSMPASATRSPPASRSRCCRRPSLGGTDGDQPHRQRLRQHLCRQCRRQRPQRRRRRRHV